MWLVWGSEVSIPGLFLAAQCGTAFTDWNIVLESC